MTDRLTLADLVRRALLPAMMLTLIAYFVFHAVSGNTGLVAWASYRAEHARLEAQAAAVTNRRIMLEHKNALLDPRHVNPDYADELIRENLKVIGRDEAVVKLPPPPPPGR